MEGGEYNFYYSTAISGNYLNTDDFPNNLIFPIAYNFPGVF